MNLVGLSREAPRLGPEFRRALVLTANELTQDARVEWMAEGLSAEFAVCELGMNAETADHAAPSCERLAGHRMRVCVGRLRHDWVATPETAAEPPLALQELTRLHVLAELPAEVLERTLGALAARAEDVARFRALARYFLHTNNALIQAGRLIGAVDVVVAADLETLPAALVLAEACGGAVFYDAHEFWPHAFVEFRDWEVEFWSNFERRLASRADLRATVSPPLAELMSREYGCEFLSVPNCVAKSSLAAVDVEAALRRQRGREAVDFLFLGGFDAGRGLEDLIAAWRHVDKRARLLLQGPDSPFKAQMVELARREGVLDNGVGFPPPVATSDLVEAARQADVGVIPYAPSCLNNRYCCPNKLSQYMAAGLPIVCNDTEFVKSVVVGNEIGVCVDFRDQWALTRAIGELAASKQTIAEMSRRARRLFEDEFNWETASRDLYARLGEIVRPKLAQRRADLDFSWIAEGREMRLRADELEGAPIFADPELKELNIELAQQNEVYCAEIARLNEVYSAEIVRLNDVYPAEIVRLNEEITRLDAAHRKLPATPVVRVYRLYRNLLFHGPAVLRDLLGARLGRSALGEALISRSVGRAALVDLARVIAAKRHCGGTLAVRIDGDILEFRAEKSALPGGDQPSAVAAGELAAALSAGRVSHCVLVAPPRVAAQSALLSEGRYELPDLLSWLAAHPDRLARLIAAGRPPCGAAAGQERYRAPSATGVSLDGR